MSETVITNGWKSPNGKCDECRTAPAVRWFGDTSVALCNSSTCYQANKNRWDEMIAEDARRAKEQLEY
jgi:hypothetical protein